MKNTMTDLDTIKREALDGMWFKFRHCGKDIGLLIITIDDSKKIRRINIVHLS